MTKCIICGNNLTEQQLQQGKRTCCRSCSIKLAYQNPEVKERHRLKTSEALKNYFKNPENRKKRSEQVKKQWQNPEIHKRMTEAINSPEVLKKISDKIKLNYQTTDLRKKVSEASKKHWADDVYRNKVVSSLQKTFASQEYKCKRSKISKQMWSNVDFYTKRILDMNKPENKSYFKEQMRLWYNKRCRTKEHQEKVRLRIANMWKYHKEELLLKRYNTMKKNGTFTNKSSWELSAKAALEDVFSLVYYQYKSDSYPFLCDFYIKDIDTYIELQYYWTHGGQPFDPTNNICLDKLKLWKDKAILSNHYKGAIYTWTHRDVEKYDYAISNNLNYLRFYTQNDFYSWLASIK